VAFQEEARKRKGKTQSVKADEIIGSLWLYKTSGIFRGILWRGGFVGHTHQK